MTSTDFCNGKYLCIVDDGVCSVVSDPTTNGHGAVIFYYGHPMLMYDGDSLQYMTSDVEECRELDYYIKVTAVSNSLYFFYAVSNEICV